jgi:Rod binding domain-containing protein
MQIDPALPVATTTRDNRLRQKAVELEAAFLAEMLAHAGFGKAEGDFTGGIGEEQFASFLRAEQAQLMAERGGIGLAESIFRALAKREESQDGA